MDTEWTILCLNQGSSSLKFAVYEMRGDEESQAATGAIEGIGLEDAGHAMLAELRQHGFDRFSAFGHRIVHGGPDHMVPQRVTPALDVALRRYIPFAPIHLPPQLHLIRTLAVLYPGL